MARIITGWIFDVYPLGEGVALWIIDRNGAKHRAWAPFAPSFFLHLKEADCVRAKNLARRLPMGLSFARTQRRELESVMRTEGGALVEAVGCLCLCRECTA